MGAVAPPLRIEQALGPKAGFAVWSEVRTESPAGHEVNVRIRRRVQPVSATPLVVYLPEISSRSSYLPPRFIFSTTPAPRARYCE
jgi:hypothetical protein